MGVTLLILGIALVVTIATVKEYMKQKDYEEAKKLEKHAEAFREEERLFEAQVSEELAKIPVESVILETNPPQDTVAPHKPKKKYYRKKKSTGKSTSQKKISK